MLYKPGRKTTMQSTEKGFFSSSSFYPLTTVSLG